MLLEIKREEREEIEVFTLKGSLTFGEEDLALRNEIETAVARGKVRIVMDLSELSVLDFTGCATLLAVHEQLRKRRGGLALACVRPARLDPIEMERLEMALKPFDSVQEAINSFFPARQVKCYDILQVVKAQPDVAGLRDKPRS